MCISASSPPSSLRFTYLHYLVGFVTDFFLVGRIVLRSSGAGFVVVLLGGYLLSSRTFSCWRVGTCCEGSWLRLLKSVLRHGDVLVEGFSVFIFVAFRFHFLGRTFLTSPSHSEFKMLFLVQGHFLEYINGLNVV